MSFKQQEHTKQLLNVLNNLLNTNDTISVDVFDSRSGYVIHIVPTNFQHPLKDILHSVRKNFFLVSKLPNTAKYSPNNSTDDEEKPPLMRLPDLPVIRKQHVYVGTPISQQVYHLLWQGNFHDNEAEVVASSLDTGSLLKLDLKDARYLASLYVQCVKQRNDLPEMWLLCDQAGTQGVGYMGVVPSAGPSPQQISTVVVRSEEYDEKKDSVSLGYQKKQHMRFHQTNQAETHGYARYNLHGTLDGCRQDPEEGQSGISIEFAWDGVREMLQPPPSSSNAVLKICADPEDVRPILPGITSELDVLVDLFGKVQKITKGESVGEVKGQSAAEESFDQGQLKKNVLEFLDKLRLQSLGQRKEPDSVSTDEPSTTISFGVAEGLSRQDFDNTESLWLFLKDLPSTNQMIFCLKVIFHQLFVGEYQPVLYGNNQTQISNLMKEVISCSSDKERAAAKAMANTVLLSPASSLEGIVDIGINKLQNDYINYFINQDLVTKHLLEYFITKTVSTSEKLQRLLKLHCILSLVTLAISYAQMKYDDLRHIVKVALKFYENHGHTEIPVFSLSLPAFSTSSSGVKNTCIREFQPQTWVAAITTTNESDGYITMVELDAKDRLESFVEGSNTFNRGNSYSITTANVHKVCV